MKCARKQWCQPLEIFRATCRWDLFTRKIQIKNVAPIASHCFQKEWIRFARTHFFAKTHFFIVKLLWGSNFFINSKGEDLLSVKLNWSWVLCYCFSLLRSESLRQHVAGLNLSDSMHAKWHICPHRHQPMDAFPWRYYSKKINRPLNSTSNTILLHRNPFWNVFWEHGAIDRRHHVRLVADDCVFHHSPLDRVNVLACNTCMCAILAMVNITIHL